MSQLTQTENRPLTHVQKVEEALIKGSGTLEDVLPYFMKGQGNRLIKRALLTMSKSDGLKKCTIDSFYKCVVGAAELGLAIDGRLAHAVPYGQEATLLIDYKGLIAVAKRSKSIRDVFARIVYKGELFEHGIRNGRCYLQHNPSVEPDEKLMIGAYAIIVFGHGDDEWRYEWMTSKELYSIKGRSRAASASFSPWKSDPLEMLKKTVLRRALKTMLDMDGQLLSAIDKDQDDLIEQCTTERDELPQGRIRHNPKPVQNNVDHHEEPDNVDSQPEPSQDSDEPPPTTKKGKLFDNHKDAQGM